MDHDLIQFDPNVFALLNPNQEFKRYTKQQLYQHICQNPSLYSNLHIMPSYRRQITKILNLKYYQQYIWPVKTNQEMYLDIINRLQYTSFFPALLDFHYQPEFVATFYHKSGVDVLNQANYVILKRYESGFFQALALKYFNTKTDNCISHLYVDLYQSDQINQMIANIHQQLDNLLGKKSIDCNFLNLPILLINCYHYSYWQLALSFGKQLEEKYFVIYDYPLNDPKYGHLVTRLAVYYHQQPDIIFYFGQLKQLGSDIVYQSETIDKWYWLDNCTNLPFYYVPLLRKFTRIYCKSESEIKALQQKRIFYQSQTQLITTFVQSMTNRPNLQSYSGVDRLDMLSHPSRGEVDRLDPNYIWIYTFKPPDEFYQICQQFKHLPLRFIVPPDDQSGPEVDNIVVRSDVDSIWPLCQGYYDPEECLSYQVFNAIVNKQLLILPKKHCCHSINLSYFTLNLNSIEQLVNLKTIRNLDHSKRLNAMIKNNLSVIKNIEKKIF